MKFLLSSEKKPLKKIKLVYLFVRDFSLGALMMCMDVVLNTSKKQIKDKENMDNWLKYIRGEFINSCKIGKDLKNVICYQEYLDKNVVAYKLSFTSNKNDYFYAVKGAYRKICIEILHPTNSNGKVIIYNPGSDNPSVIEHYKQDSNNQKKGSILQLIETELRKGFTIIQIRYNSGNEVNNNLTQTPKYISFDNIKGLTWDEHFDCIVGLSFVYNHLLNNRIEEINLIGTSYGAGLNLGVLNILSQIVDIFKIKINKVICYAGMYDVAENQYCSKNYKNKAHIILNNLYQSRKGGESMKIFAKYFILKKNVNLLFSNSPAELLSNYQNESFLNNINNIEFWVPQNDEVVNVQNTYHAYKLLSNSSFKDKVIIKIMNWSSHDPRNDINLNKFNQNDLLFDNKNLKLENIFD